MNICNSNSCPLDTKHTWTVEVKSVLLVGILKEKWIIIVWSARKKTFSLMLLLTVSVTVEFMETVFFILGLLRSNAFYIHTLISGIIAYKITNPGKHVNCCVKKSATINHKILNYIHTLFLRYLQQDCMQLVCTTLHKHVTLSRSHVVYRLCNHF